MGKFTEGKFPGIKKHSNRLHRGGGGIISTEITRQCLQYFDLEMLVLRL